MPETRADVTTPNASKYLRRLCKHWSHRFQVKYDDTHGAIDFGGDSRVEMTANAEHLLVRVFLAPEDNMAEMEDVVADHLKRVANDEPSLVVEWERVT